ncbi:hypothetical protein SAMN05660493_03171 [Epilithonimonas bovis DSM 19482]|uniref:Lipoprotein n=1 Tax=Epilithonimonas bovis DSM 19482 TaxID=1121284 RepID=A0A1U7Q0E1_9FLAO|nr:hypothetical protein [Epilithonimonas bovis]QIY84938.1 hypothetical protein HER18_16095 [Chryseobacterium sp. NEB161]SIT98559.1 hypothetical protein SAMN05660493_03171 [Epilithonimonas bovis DSM 19482]HBR11165.1 hypothetical protein [Chryseobacterium sp.]
MKKFISFGAAIALLVFVSNCREADEIVAIPETNQNIAKSAKKDSSEIKTSGSENSNATDEAQDPPKKDPIKW